MQALPGGGAMVAIAAGEEEVAGSLARVADRDRVSIAAVNGPGQVVISGAEEAVMAVAQVWRERGARVRRLRVSHGFDSPLMDPALEPLAQAAGQVTAAEPVIPVVSGVTGVPLSAEQAGSARYWVDQAREPVRFGDAVRWLAGRAWRCLPSWARMAHWRRWGRLACPMARTARPVPVMAPQHGCRCCGRGRAEPVTALLAAGELFVRGTAVDWAGMLAARGGRRVGLPTYAFQRQRYWPAPVPAAVAGTGDAGGEQARFWAAVERGDVTAVAGALGADEQARASLGGVVPGTVGVAAAQPGPGGGGPVAVPHQLAAGGRPGAGGAGGPVAGGDAGGGAAAELGGTCAEALAAHGAQVVPLQVGLDPAGPDLDRDALAALIRDALAGSAGGVPGAGSRSAETGGPGSDRGTDGGAAAVAGVLSLLALDERPGAGHGGGGGRSRRDAAFGTGAGGCGGGRTVVGADPGGGGGRAG